MQRPRTLLFALVLVACVGCDHASKRLAEQALGTTGAVSVAADVLRLEVVHNPGAFLSLGADLPPAVRTWLFGGLVPLGLLGIGLLVWRAGPPPGAAALGLGLLAGGGLGNWIDRLLNAGAVTDFLRLEVGPLHTGIFNLADVAIVAGVAVIVLARAPARSGGPAEQA